MITSLVWDPGLVYTRKLYHFNFTVIIKVVPPHCVWTKAMVALGALYWCRNTSILPQQSTNNVGAARLAKLRFIPV